MPGCSVVCRAVSLRLVGPGSRRVESALPGSLRSIAPTHSRLRRVRRTGMACRVRARPRICSILRAWRGLAWVHALPRIEHVSPSIRIFPSIWSLGGRRWSREVCEAVGSILSSGGGGSLWPRRGRSWWCLGSVRRSTRWRRVITRGGSEAGVGIARGGSRPVANSLLLPVEIILESPLRVNENLMGRLDDLKFSFVLVFAAWVAVRMVLEGELAERLLDVVGRTSRRYAQVLVVVSQRIGLNHPVRGV
jgi:hypothetical protein